MVNVWAPNRSVLLLNENMSIDSVLIQPSSLVRSIVRMQWLPSDEGEETLRLQWTMVPQSDGGGDASATELQIRVAATSLLRPCGLEMSEEGGGTQNNNNASSQHLAYELSWSTKFATPATSTLSEATVTALTTVSVVGSVAGSSLSSPTGALQQSRVVALLGLGLCAYVPTEDLPLSSNLLQLAIGREIGHAYRGAVVSAFLILLLTIVVSLLIATAIALRRAKHPMRFLPCSPVRSTESLRALILTACGDLHFPGLLVVPVSLGIQPTVTASIALFQLDDVDGGDVVLGLFGLALVGVTLAAATVCTRRWFCCELTARPVEEPQENDPSWMRLVMLVRRYTEPQKSWSVTAAGGDSLHSHSAGRLFKQQYLMLFREYRFSSFIVAELTMSAVSGFALGLRNDSQSACLAQISLLFLFNVILLGVYVVVRPALALATHLFMLVVTGSSCLCTVFSLINVLSDDESLAEVSDYMSLSTTILVTGKLLLDVISVLLFVVSFARRKKSAPKVVLIHEEMDVPELEVELLSSPPQTEDKNSDPTSERELNHDDEDMDDCSL